MSSGFITEAEIEEQRRTRQTEWEKVRKPDEPLEAPEEVYDRRTLFERLEEQRQKKDLEYEETHKLKNMIKGLDDDEIEFLDMVDRTKMAQEKRVQVEEAKELQEFRSKVAALKQQQSNKKLEDEETSISVFSRMNEPFSSGTMPQNKVLASIIKKRAASEKLPSSPPKKIASEGSSTSNSSAETSVLSKSKSDEASDLNNKCDTDSDRLSRHGAMKETMVYPSAVQRVGVLPGISSYITDDASDSECSSDLEIEDKCQEVPKNVKGVV